MVNLSTKENDRASAGSRPLPWRRLPLGYQIFIIVFSSAYGIILATRPLLDFKDRQNYLDYFSVSDYLIERRLADGLSTFFSNEPLWLLFARSTGEHLDPEVSLRLLVGIPAAIVAFVALRFGPKDFFWIVLFLLFPLVIKNHIVHLRQGLAVALFLIAYFLIQRSWLRFLLVCLCPFIHSSFFFIVMLLFISKLLRSSKLSVVYSVTAVLCACVILAFSLPTLLSLTEARQSLSVETSNLSGLGFLFWIGILFIFLNSGADFIRKAAFPFTLLTFYSASYYLFAYSGRVLESGILIILLSLLSLPISERRIALSAVAVFFFLTWVPRLGEPGFGWGL